MVEDTTSIMHHCWFITKPSHTNTQIHVILTCTYYHNIIGLSKSQLACQFSIKVAFCLGCGNAIVGIEVSIMETRHTTLLNISSYKSSACLDICHFPQLLPFDIFSAFKGEELVAVVLVL